MDPKDNPQLRDILSRATDVPVEQRAAFLDEACGDDNKLRARVIVLLATLDKADAFLGNPTVGHGDPTAESGAPSATFPPVFEGLGSRIGHYKLLQQIGEGGMGIVFMAEQEQPVRRRVALKIIKPGMDSRQVIARFEAERQALAVMDHPNIAHVYDAGATESGRPYFVMELVRGTPITEYCDKHELTTRQRLELLVEVCQAVQHAHSKGIIHRDLKPSNVLVTVADGKPVPKVIDFGVAKATQGRLTEKTLFTEFRQLLGTPQYMSPEQAESNGVDIDTRSDVYCLGVLLYELLTGTTPLDGKELRSKAYAEMERMIRESEPPKPSTRLSTIGDAANAIASRRKTEPRKLGQLLRGELDWIVMRALEKDRSRRYETANGLARDIQRYLADEPVEACPPSSGYRLRRFVRKHRVPISVAAGFALVLIAATVVSSWQAVRATEAEGRTRQQRDRVTAEKKRADDQAAIAKAVNDFFSEELLRQATPAFGGSRDRSGLNLAPDRDLKLRDALDRAAGSIVRISGKQPLVEAAIRRTLGQAYADLDEYAKAEPQLLKALEIQRGQVGEDNAEMLRSLDALGVLYIGQPQRQQVNAEPPLVRALEGRRRLLGEANADSLRSAEHLARLYLRQHRYAKAESLLLPALAMARKRTAADDVTGDVANTLGCAYCEQGWYEKAEPLLIEALECCRGFYGEKHDNTFRVRTSLAMEHAERGQYAKAEAELLDVLKDQRNLHGEVHSVTLHTLGCLVGLYTDQGKYAQAEPLALQVLASQRKGFGDLHPDTLAALCALARLYDHEGQYAKAEPLCLEALAGARQVLGETDRLTLVTMSDLAVLYQSKGQYATAEPLWVHVIEEYRKLYGDQDGESLIPVVNLAALYEERGEYAKAEPLFLKALEGLRKVRGEQDPYTLYAMDSLANLQIKRSRLDEAERLVVRAREGFAKIRGERHPDTLHAQLHVGELHLRRGQYVKAEAVFAQVLQTTRSLLGDGDPLTLEAKRFLGTACCEQGEYAKAASVLEEALSGWRKARGSEDNSRTLLTQDRLAQVYLHEGRIADAITLFGQVRDQQLKALGADNPSMLVTLTNLANAYLGAHRFDDAINLLEQVRDREQQNKDLDPDDPNTLATLSNLASAYLDAGRLADSIKLFEQVRPQMVKKLGFDDHNTLNTLGNLAGAYLRAGRTDDAIGLFEQVRDLETSKLGADHPDTLTTLDNLAQAYRDAHRSADAIKTYEQLRELKIKKFGPDNPNTLNTVCTLGWLYFNSGQYDKAEQLVVPLLANVRKREPYARAVDALNLLGETYLAQARYGEADPAFREALAGSRKALGEQHPWTSNILRNLITCCRRSGQEDKAQEWRRQLHAIVDASLAPQIRQKKAALTTRPSDPALLSDRGTMYARLGRFREAADDFTKAVELAPDNHHYWHDGLMPLLLEVGDIDGFRQRRSRELKQFRTISDPAGAHRVAKDAFMMPLEGGDLKIAVELAERGMAGAKFAGYQTKGMAEYRSGRFKEATHWFEESGKTSTEPKYQAIVNLFLAMSYERLCDHAQAQAALARAVRTMETEFPKPGEGDFNGFQDLILCRVVRREAEELINGKGPTTKPIVSTQPIVLN